MVADKGDRVAADQVVKEEMIVLSRTFDLLKWLLPVAQKFPREHRAFLTQRLLNAAFDFQEALYDANARQGPERSRHLQAADANLDKVRLYLRLAHDWHLLSDGQHKHVSKMVAEIGRLLGGWIKQTRGR